MNKRSTALLALIFLSFTSSLWAFQMPAQPAKCPDVSAIQATRFAMAKPLQDGTFGAMQLSDYGTDDSWAFVVLNITAATPKEAMQKASSALSSLSFNSGPNYFSQNNVWACFYNLSGDYQAFAITPLPSQAVNTKAIFNAVN